MASAVAGLLANVAAGALSKALGYGQGGYIEKNGLYELHKGEIVIPAAEAKKMIASYKKHKNIKSLKPRPLKPTKDFSKK
jgi:SLT domain-containing protein